MATVTPLIPISPIIAFDSRNVLVPLPETNPAVQKALEGNGGNKGSNPDLFKSELNSNRDVVVTLPETTPETQEALEENGGNTPDTTTGGTTETGNTDTGNRFDNLIRERILTGVAKEQISIPFNDNIPALTAPTNPITRRDKQLPLESVVTSQERSLASVPVNFQGNTQSPFNIYDHIINAVQGGVNMYSPLTETDNHVELEA